MRLGDHGALVICDTLSVKQLAVDPAAMFTTPPTSPLREQNYRHAHGSRSAPRPRRAREKALGAAAVPPFRSPQPHSPATAPNPMYNGGVVYYMPATYAY